MATTSPDQQIRAARARVLGGVALVIVAIGLWMMVFFQILFSFIDSVEWFPLVVSIIVDVLAVVVTLLALWTLRGGAQQLVSLQDSIPIEGLESVVGDMPNSPEPVEMDQVIDALMRLNDLDLPYSVTVEPKGDGALVKVQWRVEELKWRTVFTRGRRVMRWRLELRLDAAKGHYRFTEVSSHSELVGSGLSATLSGSKGGSRSKSIGAGSVTKVWAAGQVVSPDGEGRSGSIRVVPSDAKVPVFRILRAHGWRPRKDSPLRRLWEY